jgi:hypothetical protein
MNSATPVSSRGHERDGMRPMMIGHSQANPAVSVLSRAAAVRFRVLIWNPYIDAALPRTTLVDP